MKTLKEAVRESWSGKNKSEPVAVEYVAEPDESKSGVCKHCAGYAGKIFLLDENGHHDGPVLPVHPNCKCHYKSLTEDEMNRRI